MPIRIVKSKVSRVGPSSERNINVVFFSDEGPTLARNVRLYYRYDRQYTNLFRFRFVFSPSGLTLEVYSKMSPIAFIDGSGGKMYVFRTMNSFKISFWIVPVNWFCSTPYRQLCYIKLD